MRLLLAVTFLTVLIGCCCASIGDRLIDFRNCVSSCVDITCSNKPETTYQLPLHLRLLFWDCAQNCDYNCQRITTRQRLAQGFNVVQYHGKWPFIRLYGIQEPASVLFSILNLIPHLQGLRMLNKMDNSVSNNVSGMNNIYKVFALVGMNAWVWSSVFHVRDFLVTERLDYFSAGLMILNGFYTAVVRVFRLDREENRMIKMVFSVLCIAVYCCHVGYLQFIRFSYAYNMTFGIVVGLLQNFLWSYHAFSSYLKQDKQPHPSRDVDKTWALWPFFIVCCISGGMAFEVFDFAPIGFMLDAHALWHAATILPTYWWYWWMKRDLIYLRSIKEK